MSDLPTAGSPAPEDPVSSASAAIDTLTSWFHSDADDAGTLRTTLTGMGVPTPDVIVVDRRPTGKTETMVISLGAHRWGIVEVGEVTEVRVRPAGNPGFDPPPGADWRELDAEVRARAAQTTVRK